ncbi:hypothetical protein RI129_010197 [Pyrocoelia pectoralis]|uniref:Ankyrin repeat protein n=1 Tax=Pyrocoelia pectoralis TaxID=417401 RepID=A0AAN7V402_9COLE
MVERVVSLIYDWIRPRSSPELGKILVLSIKKESYPYKFILENFELPFLNAVKIQDLTKVELYLKLGVNVNCASEEDGDTALHIAASNGDYKMVYVILQQHNVNIHMKNKERCVPLHMCLNDSHLAIVNLLLENKANPNSVDRFGNTPLHMAARLSSTKLARLLLKYGAILNIFNVMERTPLHIALLEAPYFLFVEILVSNGAELEHEVGSLPLFLEAVLSCHSYEQLQIIFYLMNKGINVNVIEKFTKKNALHFVAMTCHTPLAIELLKYGVDPEHKDFRGRRPLDVAMEHRNESMCYILENYKTILRLIRRTSTRFL